MSQNDGKRGFESGDFIDILLYHYDILTMRYNRFIEEKANLRYDEQLFTEYLSELVTILRLILPKLKGGGKKTEAIYEKVKPFEPWTKEIMIPRVFEREKVFDLHSIVDEAYDILGLSPI